MGSLYQVTHFPIEMKEKPLTRDFNFLMSGFTGFLPKESKRDVQG